MNLSVTHRGSLHVAAAPEHALQLFTAPGERLWIEGWDPVIPGGGDGRGKGAVWITEVGGDKAYWVVVDYDADALRARYVRVDPVTHAGTVAVFARPDGAGATEVEVTYQLTALTEAGNRELAAFDRAAFNRMLAGWERAIARAELEYPLPFATAGVP
jgi:hypothetical protein